MTVPGIRSGRDFDSMENQLRTHYLRDFLTRRRARVQPGELGITSAGLRRVRGLRREEVADAVGISAAWYALFERGDRLDVSVKVLTAIADVLRFSADERTYMFMLAEAAEPPLATVDRSGPSPEGFDEVVRHPERVLVMRQDPFGMIADLNALTVSAIGFPSREAAIGVNMDAHMFTEPSMRQRYAQWGDRADHAVAALRFQAAKQPVLPQYIERLLLDREFAVRWEAHEVHAFGTHGPYTLRLPAVGAATLQVFGLPLPDGGQLRFAYGVDQDSRERLADVARRS
jgi:transcriptional regulator with XRE-family HTH domain